MFTRICSPAYVHPPRPARQLQFDSSSFAGQHNTEEGVEKGSSSFLATLVRLCKVAVRYRRAVRISWLLDLDPRFPKRVSEQVVAN